MKHVLVRKIEGTEQEHGHLLAWMKQTLGQQMFDADVLEHAGTFVLRAEDRTEVLGFLPVQQPLMLESVAFAPGMSEGEQALVMTRLAEHAIEECFRRDVGEVYFLCQNPHTAKFAENHHFKRVDLPLYRFNLREWQAGL